MTAHRPGDRRAVCILPAPPSHAPRVQTTRLGSVITSIAKRSPSRPVPDSFTPPYGIWSTRKVG
jgi:hypothetical protein